MEKINSIVYIHTLDEMLDFLNEKHSCEKKGLAFNKTIKLLNKKIKPIIDIGEKDLNALYEILKIRNINMPAEISINKYNVNPRFTLDKQYLKKHLDIIINNKYKVSSIRKLIELLEMDYTKPYNIYLKSDFIDFNIGNVSNLIKFLETENQEKEVKFSLIYGNGGYHMEIFSIGII